MKRFLAILFLLLLVVTARPATVHFALTNFGITTAKNDIIVSPTNGPVVNSPYLIIGQPIKFSTTLGQATTNLLTGSYVMSVYGYNFQRPLIFTVPNDSATYELTTLLTNGFAFSTTNPPFVMAVIAGNNITATTNAGAVTINGSAGGSGSTLSPNANQLATNGNILIIKKASLQTNNVFWNDNSATTATLNSSNNIVGLDFTGHGAGAISASIVLNPAGFSLGATPLFGGNFSGSAFSGLSFAGDGSALTGITAAQAGAIPITKGGGTNTALMGAVLTGAALAEGTVIYVATNGNNANNGLTVSTAVLTPMKGLSLAVSGTTVVMMPGNYDLGTNVLVVPFGVNLIGAGYNSTFLLGYADCSGPETGAPFGATGGPQINPRSSNIIGFFKLTCDTNSIKAMLDIPGGGAGATHSGSWSGIGVSHINPPADQAFTNVTIKSVWIKNGLPWDCIHYNSDKYLSISVEDSILEIDGGSPITTQADTVNSANQSSYLRFKNCTLLSNTNSALGATWAGLGLVSPFPSAFLYNDKAVILENCKAVNHSVVSPLSGPQGFSQVTSGGATPFVYVYGGQYTNVSSGDSGGFNQSTVFGYCTYNNSNVWTLIGNGASITNIHGDNVNTVYSTGTSGTSTNAGQVIVRTSDWHTNGNANVSVDSFIGTTTARNLNLRVNNTNMGILDTNLNVTFGDQNSNTTSYGTIMGGLKNTNHGNYNFIGGGTLNTIGQDGSGTAGINTYDAIIGGNGNWIGKQFDYSVILGGSGNVMSNNPSDGGFSAILAGQNNKIGASGQGAILGGSGNYVRGIGGYAFAGGYNAFATNFGSWVLNDSSGLTVGSSTNDEMTLGFSNGVRVLGPLNIKGAVNASNTVTVSANGVSTLISSNTIISGNQTNSGSIQASTLNITGNATVGGTLQLVAERYTTNASTMAPDFNLGYTLISTNAAFTVLAPINVDTTKTLAQTTVFQVTNTTAAAVAITPPANVHFQGTWFVTNWTTITFYQYGQKITNAIALPLF